MAQRDITRITQNPWHEGFLGKGHKALAVLEGVPYTDSDPFILFMDDSLDLPGGPPVGGPHPHAGFETLTLVLEGNGKDWKTGSFELMTAGEGIVHTEEITSRQKLRILQVWLVLPPEKRWAQPFLQKILLEDVPKIKTEDHEIRVYSGSSNGLTSPLQNHTPFILVDFRTGEGVNVSQEVPAGYNGLIYVLNGSVKVGDQVIKAEQTGWLAQTNDPNRNEVQVHSLKNNTHFVLYAGQPHNVPVVHYGPFVANTMDEIAKLYKVYRNGAMPHLNDLPAAQKKQYTNALR